MLRFCKRKATFHSLYTCFIYKHLLDNKILAVKFHKNATIKNNLMVVMVCVFNFDAGTTYHKYSEPAQIPVPMYMPASGDILHLPNDQ